MLYELLCHEALHHSNKNLFKLRQNGRSAIKSYSVNSNLCSLFARLNLHRTKKREQNNKFEKKRIQNSGKKSNKIMRIKSTRIAE